MQLGSNPPTLKVAVTISKKAGRCRSSVIIFSNSPSTIFPLSVFQLYECQRSGKPMSLSLTLATNVIRFPISISLGQETETTGQGRGPRSQATDATALIVTVARALLPLRSATTTTASYVPGGCFSRLQKTVGPDPSILPTGTSYV